MSKIIKGLRTSLESKEENSDQMLSGSVTFLDVLGWKGIWLTKPPGEVIHKLQQVVDLAKRTSEGLRGTDEFVNVDVISISDTIVLLSSGSPNKTLQSHGRICSKLIPDSIRKGIPMRGATAYGKFLSGNKTTLIGPAVDEAAAWHEATNWMGVIMTPSAEYQYNPSLPWIRYPETPTKSPGIREFFVVDWSKDMSQEEIRTIFAGAGTLEPTIAPKYTQTLKFLEWSRAQNL